jgi:predicted dehydrogenase
MQTQKQFVHSKETQMTDTLRVGVVGTSWYADTSHLARIKSHPRAELAAVCGRNRSRAEEMAGKYGIPLVFTDHREMIEKGNLDAVIVSTPDDLHYPMTMDALDAGLHVLCEKPLALNVEQAKAMYEKAERVGVKHMVSFTNRWAPWYRYLKQLLDEGYAGRLLHCNIRYLVGYDWQPRYSWRFDRRHGTGILGDLGRWFVGDIARVSAHLGIYADHPGPNGQASDPVNDAVLLAVEFANGAHGAIQISGVALNGSRAMEQHIALHGQSGTLEVDSDFAAGVTVQGMRLGEERFQELAVPDELCGDVNRNQPPIVQIMEACTQQPIGDRQFIDAILDDEPVAPSFYDGLKVQEVIDAAIQSHEQGVWVSL